MTQHDTPAPAPFPDDASVAVPGRVPRDGVADPSWLQGSPRHGLGSSRQILVWDLLVRVFHWSLVISFFTGFFITKKFPLHAYTGYTIFCLVLMRIVWGFVGTKYARFSAFIYTVRETVQYTISAFRRAEAPEYLSHNPMGAVMVFAILFLLLGNAIVGMMLLGAQQLEGPLAEVVPTAWDEDLLEIHGLLARVLISFACLHVTGVIWSSWWHRQNYVLAMFTGYKSAFKRRSKRRGDGQVWTAEQRAEHRSD